MSPEANKRLVRHFITEVINAGNLDALSVFVADQIIIHLPSYRIRSRVCKVTHIWAQEERDDPHNSTGTRSDIGCRFQRR